MVESQATTAPASSALSVDQITKQLSEGYLHHNIDEAVREIYAYKKDHPSEFREFVKNVNCVLHDGEQGNGELPGISLVDVDESGRNIILCDSAGRTAMLSSTGPSPVEGESASAPSAPSEPRDQPDECTVVVQKGDSLWKIARRLLIAKHKGEHPDDPGYVPSNEEIRKAVKAMEDDEQNPFRTGRNPDLIKVGEKIHASVGDAPPAEQPADKPAEQPADKPAEQPADKPAEQPADKPAEQPADKPAEQPAQTQQMAIADKHFNPSEDGSYNPACPPGFTADNCAIENSMSGTSFGSGNIPVRSREVASPTTDAEGNVTNRYSGRLNNSYLPFGDADYSAEETVGKDGRLLSRHIIYTTFDRDDWGDGVNITFQAPGGPKEIKNVKQIDTTYNAATGKYETTITTCDWPQPKRYKVTQGAGDESPTWQEVRS